MGGGSWNVGDYASHVRATAAAGKSAFDYSDRISRGYTAAAVNELLDPKRVCGATSRFAGKVMREVVLSDEHPNPTPIALVLDVTGSNISAAEVVHSKLPQLLGILQRKGYVEDPQLNFSAIGDANSDRVPLQMGSFESDNRIDAQLEGMYLEGAGGGQMSETYELAAYFLARHSYLESFHKQGRKGYVFFIGDELPYDKVRKSQVRSLIGDDLESDIPTSQVFAELQEQFEVFFLFQAQGSYSAGQVLPTWKKLLGERALVLDDPAAVCEFIAGLLAVLEGGLDLDEAEADLLAIGADPASVRVASKALAKATASYTGSAIAHAEGNLPIAKTDTGTSRL